MCGNADSYIYTIILPIPFCYTCSNQNPKAAKPAASSKAKKGGKAPKKSRATEADEAYEPLVDYSKPCHPSFYPKLAKRKEK